MDDDAAAAFYDDPANLRPAGRGRPVRSRKMTAHIPVRFDAAMIEQVKVLADRDGMTVSSWIRRAVRDQMAPRGVTALTTYNSAWAAGQRLVMHP